MVRGKEKTSVRGGWDFDGWGDVCWFWFEGKPGAELKMFWPKREIYATF
jgi:hypothetical protein